MSSMPQDPFGTVSEGVRWCPHCNGYGSSLKEHAERCSRCAGTDLVVDEAAALSPDRAGNGSSLGDEPLTG